MEKETWYRKENTKEEDIPEDWELPDGWKIEKERGVKRKGDQKQGGKRKKVKGVMFLPHTHHSELAGEIRSIENHFEETTD